MIFHFSFSRQNGQKFGIFGKFSSSPQYGQIENGFVLLPVCDR